MVQPCGLGSVAFTKNTFFWSLMSDCHIYPENNPLGISHRTHHIFRTQPVTTLRLSCEKYKQFTGEDILFIASQLHFLFFFPQHEKFSENLNIGGERCRVQTHLLTSQPKIFSVSKPSLKGTEQCKEKVRGRAAGGGGGKGAFPGLS